MHTYMEDESERRSGRAHLAPARRRATEMRRQVTNWTRGLGRRPTAGQHQTTRNLNQLRMRPQQPVRQANPDFRSKHLGCLSGVTGDAGAACARNIIESFDALAEIRSGRWLSYDDQSHNDLLVV
jgi:hypothetical protein